MAPPTSLRMTIEVNYVLNQLVILSAAPGTTVRYEKNRAGAESKDDFAQGRLLPRSSGAQGRLLRLSAA
jgi:hypothetical protein